MSYHLKTRIASEALSQIVDDLFDLSRIKSGLLLPIELTECDLNKIVREVGSHYQKGTAKYQFEITLEGETNLYVEYNMRPQVFDKFYRANYSNTAVSALDLGMSIVKAIIEGHGGHIWVESKIDEGPCISCQQNHTNVTFTDNHAIDRNHFCLLSCLCTVSNCTRP